VGYLGLDGILTSAASKTLNSMAGRIYPTLARVQILDTGLGFLRVRSGPGTNYSEIGKATPGDKYTYLGKSGDWLKIDFNGNNNHIFGRLTRNGNDDVAQWLFHFSHDIGKSISIHTKYDGRSIIYRLWGNNNQPMIRWLSEFAVDNYGDKVDLHFDNDTMFRTSCSRPYPDFAQWLVEFSIKHGYPINLGIDNCNSKGLCRYWHWKYYWK